MYSVENVTKYINMDFYIYSSNVVYYFFHDLWFWWCTVDFYTSQRRQSLFVLCCVSDIDLSLYSSVIQMHSFPTSIVKDFIRIP